MRKVSELNYKEWDKLVRSLTDDKKKAKKLCKKMKVDFHDVKSHDWGFDWQYQKGVSYVYNGWSCCSSVLWNLVSDWLGN